MAKLILTLILLSAGFVRAAELEARWYLLPEPSWAGLEVTRQIPGAEKTVLAPAIGTGAKLEFPTAAEFSAANPDESAFLAAVGANADQILASLTAEWFRDSKKVIQYGMLRADYPLAGAVLTAPHLLARFETILGPRILVVVPNRRTVLLFPGQAGDPKGQAKLIEELYRATPYPVSLEIFEVSAAGIRAIGAFE